RGTERRVVVGVLGRRADARRAMLSLRPDRTIGVDVHFLDRPGDAAADVLDLPAAVVVGHALVAHLGFDLVPPRRFGQHARLADVVSERLLAVDVRAHLYGHHGG